MIERLVDVLVEYIEFCAYADVCEKLNVENDLKLRYGDNWSDMVDEVVRKAINNNHDALYTSILNGCCDAFELDDEARAEVKRRLKDEVYAK